MVSFFSRWSQMYPPKPGFTEKDIGNLYGKVYIVTGSNTGVGKEVARILYSRNAKVYVAGRSKDRCLKAIEDIRQGAPSSAGTLAFLHLDLADLATIKASAEEFLSKEDELHVLFNNAGVQAPPEGTKSAQGYELHIGVNNLGTFMLTKLLTPILVATAKKEPPNTVRVVWVASMGAEMGSHEPGGVNMDNLDFHEPVLPLHRYSISKAGNYLHGTEFAKRHTSDGIVSIPLNPGHLDSDLYRHGAFNAIVRFILRLLLLYPPVYGAYTELFAGLSPGVTIEKSGEWVVPWGRFADIREDLVVASRSEAEGGTGLAQRWWQWNEDQIKGYL